jgi:hypothetical protein
MSRISAEELGYAMDCILEPVTLVEQIVFAAPWSPVEQRELDKHYSLTEKLRRSVALEGGRE